MRPRTKPGIRQSATRILLVAFLVLLVAVPAAAQTTTDPPTVIYVDARETEAHLGLLAETYDVSAGDIKIEQSGRSLEVSDLTTAQRESWPVEMVFVVDLDNRNAADGGLTRATSAIATAAASLPEGSRVGLVSAGRVADVQVPLTTSRDRLDVGLSQLSIDKGSALLDAAGTAGRMFDAADSGLGRQVVRSVVVVTGGADTTSVNGREAAASGLIQNSAQLLVVNLGTPSPELAELAGAVGGSSIAASDDQDVADSIQRAVSTGADRLLVSFDQLEPTEDDAVADRASVKISIADQTRILSYPRGMETANILQLGPLTEVETSRFAFLGNEIFLYVSVGLAFLGISTGVWALASMFGGGESQLDRVLARYSEGKEVDEEEVREMLVQTELLQRAVDFTEGFARRRGFLSRIEELLERADLPIRPGEGMFFLIGISVLVLGLIWSVTTSILVALLAAVASGWGAYGAVVFLAHRRLKNFESQLPDTLQLLAGTLRAGYSLPQGIDAVSNEIADPMGEELRRAVTEAQLGRELEDALASVAERLHSDDFSWTVMAIGIQREVGGNLNELLMTVAETMVQRERLKREVAALTAEGRVSALILSLLPPGLGTVLYVMNPDYVSLLFSRTLGMIMLGLAVVSGVIGLLWMKKVITIDA